MDPYPIASDLDGSGRACPLFSGVYASHYATPPRVRQPDQFPETDAASLGWGPERRPIAGAARLDGRVGGV